MDAPAPDRPGPAEAAGWLRNTNRNADLIALIRRARRALPGDPDFGDPLSAAGEGGARAAARAADRLMPDRGAATREVSLATLQVWQALTERISGRPANAEVTLVFTDLVGFSDWSLEAGDEATLRLLRAVAAAAEPPMLAVGGHIVKRMGDGMMAVFTEPATAVRATVAACKAVGSVEVEGFRPRMRAGVHTGRPQRIGADWLGVDVNIAARVMERATRGGLIVSEATFAALGESRLRALGLQARRVRRPLFAPRQGGVPADMAMYWLKADPDVEIDVDADHDSAE